MWQSFMRFLYRFRVLLALTWLLLLVLVPGFWNHNWWWAVAVTVGTIVTMFSIAVCIGILIHAAEK